LKRPGRKVKKSEFKSYVKERESMINQWGKGRIWKRK